MPPTCNRKVHSRSEFPEWMRSAPPRSDACRQPVHGGPPGKNFLARPGLAQQQDRDIPSQHAFGAVNVMFHGLVVELEFAQADDLVFACGRAFGNALSRRPAGQNGTTGLGRLDETEETIAPLGFIESDRVEPSLIVPSEQGIHARIEEITQLKSRQVSML